MMRPRPCLRAESRLALALMSTMVTLPESTIESGASCKTSAAWTTRDQSSAPTRRPRIRSQGTPASPHSRRIPISHLDISSENIATGTRDSTAAFLATFVANEDFPTPGRAATITRFPDWRPDSSSSRSRNPVGRPAKADSPFWILWSRIPHLHDVARGLDQPPQERVLRDDPRVVARRGGCRHLLDELVDVQVPADLFQYPAPPEVLDSGDRIDRITPPVDPPEGVEDRAVRGLVEVLGLDHLDDVGDGLRREHHGAEDGLLGFQVVGRYPFGPETADIVSSRRQRSPSPEPAARSRR